MRLPATEALGDAESRLSDDPLSLEESVFYVKRVRACEALLELIEREGAAA